MSLDVYLVGGHTVNTPLGSGIFVRENGRTIEISEECWRKLHPDREPVRSRIIEDETNELYTANITHNLAKMADVAGVYGYLWRPDELGIKKARELIRPLHAGLGRLWATPKKYQKYNPDNGWGDYDGLCDFVLDYVRACVKYPDARVEVSR